MSLLQSGWMEALLVGVARRSQRTGGEELVFAENLQLTEAQCRAAGLADLYEALRLLSLRYQLMQLSGEEAVMLKAIALANSGTHQDSASTHTVLALPSLWSWYHYTLLTSFLSSD